MKQQQSRTPLAFIDKTGYVTPFNGRMDTTLSGWYIYTEEELKKALAQQRRLEDNRVVSDREVIGTHYAIDDVDVEQATGTEVVDDTPDWAANLFGAENVVPYLQLEKDTPSQVVVPTVNPKQFHEEQTNVDLTPEQIEELQGTVPSTAALVQQVLG